VLHKGSNVPIKITEDDIEITVADTDTATATLSAEEVVPVLSTSLDIVEINMDDFDTHQTDIVDIRNCNKTPRNNERDSDSESDSETSQSNSSYTTMESDSGDDDIDSDVDNKLKEDAGNYDDDESDSDGSDRDESGSGSGSEYSDYSKNQRLPHSSDITRKMCKHT